MGIKYFTFTRRLLPPEPPTFTQKRRRTRRDDNSLDAGSSLEAATHSHTLTYTPTLVLNIARCTVVFFIALESRSREMVEGCGRTVFRLFFCYKLLLQLLLLLLLLRFLLLLCACVRCVGTLGMKMMMMRQRRTVVWEPRRFSVCWLRLSAAAADRAAAAETARDWDWPLVARRSGADRFGAAIFGTAAARHRQRRRRRRRHHITYVRIAHTANRPERRQTAHRAHSTHTQTTRKPERTHKWICGDSLRGYRAFLSEGSARTALND